MGKAKQANAIDRLVAGRIRAHRKERGMSQTELAIQLGLTFQQVQKYEKGVNRVGAGRLFELARIFGVPIQALFPESSGALPCAEFPSGEAKQISEFAMSADGWRLFRAFIKITDAKRRRSIIALVQQMAEYKDSGTAFAIPPVPFVELC
jgi:transcriptional regulator with XRE-family HTH domain